MEEFVVIKYTGESTKSLTNGKLYAVETDEDFIDAEVFENFEAYTVFDDKGHLQEITKENYEIVSGDEKEWYKNRSKVRYIEMC